MKNQGIDLKNEFKDQIKEMKNELKNELNKKFDLNIDHFYGLLKQRKIITQIEQFKQFSAKCDKFHLKLADIFINKMFS